MGLWIVDCGLCLMPVACCRLAAAPTPKYAKYKVQAEYIPHLTRWPVGTQALAGKY
jgi:hypothetical protein